MRLVLNIRHRLIKKNHLRLGKGMISSSSQRQECVTFFQKFFCILSYSQVPKISWCSLLVWSSDASRVGLVHLPVQKVEHFILDLDFWVVKWAKPLYYSLGNPMDRVFFRWAISLPQRVRHSVSEHTMSMPSPFTAKWVNKPYSRNYDSVGNIFYYVFDNFCLLCLFVSEFIYLDVEFLD